MPPVRSGRTYLDLSAVTDDVSKRVPLISGKTTHTVYSLVSSNKAGAYPELL